MMNEIKKPDCNTKLLPCLFCGNEVHSDWAIVYEYARSMKDYLDDNDKESLKACIERVEELAMEHDGNKINQLMLYLDKHKDDHHNVDSCINIIEASDWLLERTMDIKKREKLHSIALEATKALRNLVNTP